MEEESETKKEQGAVLTCSSLRGLYVGGGRERAGEKKGHKKEKEQAGSKQYVWCVKENTSEIL